MTPVFSNPGQPAKLFSNGGSQAVRLPAAFRFEGAEVWVRRDATTGDVILSQRNDSWDGFFEHLSSLNVPSDFMADRQDAPPQTRPEL